MGYVAPLVPTATLELLTAIARGRRVLLELPRRDGLPSETLVVAACPSGPNERLAEALEDGRGTLLMLDR